MKLRKLELEWPTKPNYNSEEKLNDHNLKSSIYCVANYLPFDLLVINTIIITVVIKVHKSHCKVVNGELEFNKRQNIDH